MKVVVNSKRLPKVRKKDEVTSSLQSIFPSIDPDLTAEIARDMQFGELRAATLPIRLLSHSLALEGVHFVFPDT